MGPADRCGPEKRVFEPPRAGRWLSILQHVVFHRALFRELAAFMAQVEPDVVHLHNNYRYPLSILAACRQRRVVQTVHDYCAIYPTAFCVRPRSCAGRSVLAALRHGCVGWRLLATEGVLLYGRRYLDRRLVQRFIAPSRHLAEHLDRAGHRGVRHIANFHVPDAGGTGWTAIDPTAELVLYVGSLVAHKGVGLLLAAFEQIAAKRANARLVGRGRWSRRGPGSGLPYQRACRLGCGFSGNAARTNLPRCTNAPASS